MEKYVATIKNETSEISYFFDNISEVFSFIKTTFEYAIITEIILEKIEMNKEV